MAITLITSPANFGRANDTNRLTYKFSSSTYAQPNFQFQFKVTYWGTDGSQNNGGTFNVYPDSGGTVEFNPSSILRNFLSYDFDVVNTFSRSTNTAKLFTLDAYEYYGTPPVSHAVAWTGNMTCYNAAQQNIPYDYIPLNPSGNTVWIATSGGSFLTDAPKYELDNDDYAQLSFLVTQGRKPTQIRYKVYYSTRQRRTMPVTTTGTVPTAVNPAQTMAQTSQINIDPSSGQIYTAIPPAPISASTALNYYLTGLTLGGAYDYAYAVMAGPKNLIDNGWMTNVLDRWIYYEIDLLSGTTVLNARPFTVFNKQKCNKYDKTQLFWLNPHGGFDTFVFNKKKDVDYKIKRTTYKQRLPTAYYSTYSAGERVFNVDVVEEQTLRSDSVTQQESQLLIQLTQSPVVFTVTTYTKMTTIPAFTDYYFSYTDAQDHVMPSGYTIWESQTEGVFVLMNTGLTVVDADVYHDGLGAWSHRSGVIYTSKTTTDPTIVNQPSAYAVPVIVSTEDVNYGQKKNSKEIFYEIKIRQGNQKITQRD